MSFQYYIENCPAAQNEKAEIRKLEPYCYGQFTEQEGQKAFLKDSFTVEIAKNKRYFTVFSVLETIGISYNRNV